MKIDFLAPRLPQGPGASFCVLGSIEVPTGSTGKSPLGQAGTVSRFNRMVRSLWDAAIGHHCSMALVTPNHALATNVHRSDDEAGGSYAGDWADLEAVDSAFKDERLGRHFKTLLSYLGAANGKLAPIAPSFHSTCAAGQSIAPAVAPTCCPRQGKEAAQLYVPQRPGTGHVTPITAAMFTYSAAAFPIPVASLIAR